MIDLLDVENDRGYKIIVGKDVLPADVRLNVDMMNKLLDQFKDLKITSNNDYLDISDKLKTVESMRDKISECEEKSIGPINDLANAIVNEIDPTKNKVTETEVIFKQLISNWEVSPAKIHEEEMALEEKRKADVLEKQKEEEMNIEIERKNKEELTPENFSNLSIDEKRTILEDYRNQKINIEETAICPICHSGHIHSVEPGGITFKCTNCGKEYVMVDKAASYKCANCGVPISEELKMDACPFCNGKKALKFNWAKFWKIQKPIIVVK